MSLPLRPWTTPYLNSPSKLAGFRLQRWRLIGLPLRACSERCPQCSYSIYLLCALREHGRPTASILHFPCAHSGSTGAIWVSFLPFLCAAFGEQEDDQAARAYSSISLTDRVWPFSVILASIRSPGFARVGTFVSRVSFNSMCWPVAVVTV